MGTLRWQLLLRQQPPPRADTPSLACAPPPLPRALQLGHQAAECPNGTVNWKGVYGEDAFVLRPPVYESQLRERRQYKTVDADKLAARAQEYAKVRRTAGARVQCCVLCWLEGAAVGGSGSGPGKHQRQLAAALGGRPCSHARCWRWAAVWRDRRSRNSRG